MTLKLRRLAERASAGSVGWGLVLHLAALWAPPIIHSNLLLPCWECYDFEAPATHEVTLTLTLTLTLALALTLTLTPTPTLTPTLALALALALSRWATCWACGTLTSPVSVPTSCVGAVSSQRVRVVAIQRVGAISSQRYRRPRTAVNTLGMP